MPVPDETVPVCRAIPNTNKRSNNDQFKAIQRALGDGYTNLVITGAGTAKINDKYIINISVYAFDKNRNLIVII